MKRLIFVEKGVAEISGGEMPVCGKDAMLLKTLYSGVTNGTERINLMGYGGGGFPRCFNYQTVSRVEECGAGITKYKPGDIVYCGKVAGHVEYQLAEETDLLLDVTEGYDLREAALFGVASVSFHDAGRAGVNYCDKAAIFGAGIVGQFAAQAAGALGAHVTVVDIDEDRLSLALSLGADRAVNISSDEGKQTLYSMRPFSVIFDCSGADIMQQVIGDGWANGLIGNRGRVLMIAGRYDVTYAFGAAQSTEVAVMHANHFNQDALEGLGRLVKKGVIKVSPLIKDVAPIDDAVRYYDIMRDTPGKLMGTVFEW